MTKKIIKFDSNNSGLLSKAFEIRTRVFINEQKVDQKIEKDGLDKEAVHYILFYDNIPSGTIRRRHTKEGIKLERLAVLKPYRGLGFGGELLQFILDDILPTKKKIYLNSQSEVIDIYIKYGFKIYGEKFFEADIEHYKMVYEPA